MKWESQGLIFSKKNFPKWNITHAWVPTPIMIKKSICRVYYAGRNKNNMSQIGAFDIDLNNPKKIRKVFKKPLLELGKRGHFDDCAVIPSHIFKVKNHPTREEVAKKLLEYLEKEVKLGTKVNHIMRHTVGLYHGQIGSKNWKRYLSDNMMARDSDFQKAKHIMSIVQNNEKANQTNL